MTIELFGLEVDLLAQVFGFLGLLAMCISFFCKDKKGYAGVMVFAHLLFAAEAFTLGGYSNVVTNSTGALRNGTVFVFLQKKKKDPPGWSMLLFAAVAVGGAAFFLDGVLSVIPVACFLFQCAYLASKNFLFLKFGSLAVEGTMCVYNVFMGAYVGAIRQIVACSVLIVSIVNYFKEKEKDVFGQSDVDQGEGRL